MKGLDDPWLSDLYRAAPQPEPGRDSDRIVLDAARRAVGGRHGFGYGGWALAATLVLGMGIGWQLLQAPPEVASLSRVPAAGSPATPGNPARSLESAKAGITSGTSSSMKRRESVADMESVPAAPTVGQGVPMAADSERGELASGEPANPACRELWLAKDRPREAWLAAISRARAAGETHLESCLQQGYRQSFFEKQP